MDVATQRHRELIACAKIEIAHREEKNEGKK